MDRRFVLLLACFLLSGFAALLYQTAWTRELSFVFGTSDLAVAAVLAAYMGGLALGAAAAARFAPSLRRPVLVYGLLELAIAVSALLVPAVIGGVNAVYVALFASGTGLAEPMPATVVFQLLGAAAALLPPTALMGATLPLLARHAVQREEQIASRIGVLYAVNTAGAIAGTLCAAFLLMPELGLRQTVWVGAALNAVVFALAAGLARAVPAPAPASAASEGPAMAAGSAWVLGAMALSGAVSFTYEVAWTRLLGHLLGASLHAFATMLASFLLGIALGSAAAARLASTRQRAAVGFAVCQLGTAIASFAAFALADRLPALSLSLGAGPGAAAANALLAGAALLPITLCIGATFPFAVRVRTASPEAAARGTAQVYAWNTLGAIAGSLAAGFVLLPSLGFEGTVAVGVLANLALAALASLRAPQRRLLPAGIAAALALGALVFPPVAPMTLLSASPMNAARRPPEILHHAVGRTTSVMLFEAQGRYRLTTDGLPEAGVDPVGSLSEGGVAQWLGALPGVLRPEARDVLVVGLGGGVALEVMPSSYASVDVIELEPEVLAANRLLSPLRARDPLADPRVRVHLGDARGMLQLAGRRFDAIVSQPSHPWTAGASHLYTREFFDLVRSRLAPGGVFVQWMGINFVDDDLVRSLVATLLDAFPHVEVFRPRNAGLLFAASDAPIDTLAGARRALANAPADFARLGVHRIEDFAATWALDEAGARRLAEGAPRNTDDHNRLASRSARLGDDKLDEESAAALLREGDPLRGVGELVIGPLARRLLNLGQQARATDLAIVRGGTEAEIGLGWVALAARQSARALRYFRRAVLLAPDDEDAHAGRVQAEWTAGHVRATWPSEEAERWPSHHALHRAWGLARAEDWEAVRALDRQLAAIRPGHGLFVAASRVRARAWLATGEASDARVALGITEPLLVRRAVLRDSLLRAEAALRAGEPEIACASLERVAHRLVPGGGGRGLAVRASRLARELPEGQPRFERIRALLARRVPAARS